MTHAIKRIIRYTAHAADPEAIILFGSFASGKNNIHSDLDLLVVSTQTHRRKELEKQVSSFAREFALSADILIHSPEEIEEASRSPLSFLGSIVKDGKPVYKKKEGILDIAFLSNLSNQVNPGNTR